MKNVYILSLLFLPFLSYAGYKKHIAYVDYNGMVTAKLGSYTITKSFNSSKIPDVISSAKEIYQIEDDIESAVRDLLNTSKPSFMSLDYANASLFGNLAHTTLL